MKIMLIVVLMVMVAGAVYAGSLEVTKKAGANTVTVTLRSDPPSAGVNPVTVSVRDAAGKPVTTAAVVVEYGMPGMPGMPPMSYKEPLAPAGQVYKGNLNFSMAGPWQVTVKVRQGGKTNAVKFSTDVH